MVKKNKSGIIKPQSRHLYCGAVQRKSLDTSLVRKAQNLPSKRRNNQQRRHIHNGRALFLVAGAVGFIPLLAACFSAGFAD